MEANRLTAEHIMNFKLSFESELNKLVYTQAIVNEGFQIHQDDLLDTMDLTSSERETSMRMRLRNRETLYAKKIREALLRIQEGTFGDCQECGEEIDIKRLHARPTATLCVSCKEEQEVTEMHHIDGHIPKSLGTQF